MITRLSHIIKFLPHYVGHWGRFYLPTRHREESQGMTNGIAGHAIGREGVESRVGQLRDNGFHPLTSDPTA
jgi:hypothetical protein